MLWSPPYNSVFKLNVDASLTSISGVVGVGFVIRDDFGHVRAAGSLKLKTFFHPLLAEAVALLHGVWATLSSGFSPILVESDALGVVNVLKEGSSPTSDLVGIRVVCRSLNILCFSFVPRTMNKFVDALAKVALSSISYYFLFEVCLPLVELLVQDDFLG
ncbi:hypothetical protein ACOSQ3_015070 [Xanthoceras sorbifolium]